MWPVPKERQYLAEFLEKQVEWEPFIATAELVLAAQGHFRKEDVGSTDVYAALQRLVNRGRLMQLRVSAESRYLHTGGDPRGTLALICKASWCYFVAQQETDELWAEMELKPRF